MNEKVVVTGRRLGREKPKFDPERLSVRRYADLSSLPASPAAWDQTSLLTVLGEMLNDTLGDCTCAEVGHQIQFWTAVATGTEITVPDSAVEALYELAGRYVPGDPSTDNGAVISDVLGDMKSTGCDGHKYAGFASVPLDDQATQQQCMWLWGGLDAGWNLPIACQSMSGTWDVPEGQELTGDWEPGSWGGHSTLICAYDGQGNWKTVSWGQVITVTQSFIAAYCEELWAAVAQDWIEANGTDADGGFNLSQLEADFSEITGQPTPTPTPTPPTPTPPGPTPEPNWLIRRVESTLDALGRDIKKLANASDEVKAEVVTALQDLLHELQGSTAPTDDPVQELLQS